MFTNSDFKVELMNGEDVKSFIKRHGDFSRVCYNTPEHRAEGCGLHCLKSGHLSGSRHLYFEFRITNVPRHMIDQLVRHEVGITKNVQSLRYVDKSNMSIYFPPEVVNDINLLADFKTMEMELKVFHERIKQQLIEKGITNKERVNEICRTFIPIGVSSSCSFACNLEGLINLCHKRLCTRAEQPIRLVVQAMVKAVLEVEPRYKEFLVPQCEYLGRCPEGKHGCGRVK